MYSTTTGVLLPGRRGRAPASVRVGDVSQSTDNMSESQGIPGDHVAAVLAQWARERPDLDTAPLAVVARLGRASAFVEHGVEALLGQHGLTRQAWDVLASLRRAGPPYRRSPTALYTGLMRT